MADSQLLVCCVATCIAAAAVAPPGFVYDSGGNQATPCSQGQYKEVGAAAAASVLLGLLLCPCLDVLAPVFMLAVWGNESTSN